jgi:hypothetical protein
MPSSRSIWILVVVLAWFGFGRAVAQQPDSELSSLPESPPLLQTIFYVGKSTTTDFRGPGMGQHLQYFPAFGLETTTFGLRTDCEACLERTPDFENFKHHVPADLFGRTFSPDDPGFGTEGDEDYLPEGVKTAGGNPNWDVFTLPDGTVGISGTTYDRHACGNTNNTVNQIRINTSTLHDFCLNIITDNTNRMHDPAIRIGARSDEVDRSLESDPDLSFDGETDMYTFRYMGMQEGDRIKIRIEGAGDEDTCAGVGLGGIMVSHISTCTPPPDTCTPNCAGRPCGDDGCGGSCGVCPRADNLVRIEGEVDVTITQNGDTRMYSQSDVETPVQVSDSLSRVLDEIEAVLATSFHEELVQSAEDAPIALDVRNYRLVLTPKTIRIDLTAMGPPNEGLFEMIFTLGGFTQHAKFKPESDVYNAGSLNPNAQVDVTTTNMSATGTYDPQTGEIRGPYDPATSSFGPDPIGSVGGVNVVVSTNDDWDNLVDIAQVFDFDAPESDALASQFEMALRAALVERLGPTAGQELDGLLRPAVVLVPAAVEIDGVDYAPQIRNALLNPTPGQRISILYDASTPQLISETDPIERAILATLSVAVGNGFSLTSRVMQTTFPPILGNIESTSLDLAGNFVVEGWTCGTNLTRSLDVGLFADGVTVRVERADRDSEAAISETCGTDGTLNRYRYSLTSTSEEVGCINGWDNRLSVIAGDDGFEKDLGEVHRASAAVWLDGPLPGGTAVFPSNNKRQFVADFDADGRADYLWERQGWWVALSQGDGFAPPTLWLPNDVPGVGSTRPSNDARLFVADFDADGRSDFLYENYGWWVARSNGNGFDAPTRWMPNNIPGIGSTFPPDSQDRQFVADFNGDGSSDYLWEHYGWHVALSNGNGFDVSTVPWLSNSVSGIGKTIASSASRQFVADLDGDGRSDYLWERNGWYAALSNGAGFDAPSLWMASREPDVGWTFPPDAHSRQFVADFDGDGRSDYLWEYGGWWVARSNGAGFEPPTLWMTSRQTGVGYTFPPDAHARQFVADFNGDGRTDYFWEYNGWWVVLSNGAAFEAPKRWLRNGENGVDSPFPNSSSSRQFVADLTGDGFPDYMWESDGWYVSSTFLQPGVCDSLDTDHDGISNIADNCPMTANPSQVDTDLNGLGDACDHECSDGEDNDDDGLIDWPTDSDCDGPTGILEVPEPGIPLSLLVGALGLAASKRRRR